MRRFYIAVALTCLMSVSALAGDMPTGGYAPPSPNDPPPAATLNASSNVEDPCDSQESEDIALTLIQGLVGLLTL